MANDKQAVASWVELWKAIHGGCWPGPPADNRISEAVNEIISSLAVYNLSHAFQDKAIGESVKRTAAQHLQKSLAALQNTLQG